MAIGGPAGFAAGFLQGIARHRQTANTRVREQLNEALRLQKEAREAQDAIAKEGLAGEKAKAEAALAQNELDLIEQRRAEIMASSGKPFKDSALEGRLAAARERLADAQTDTIQSRNRLQDLIESRDERVSRGIPATKAGGFLGFGQKEVPPEQRTPEQREAYKAARRKAELADSPENRDFNKEFRQDYRDIESDKRQESKERAAISGEERAIEVGKGEQGAVNEEERKKELYPLDKQASEYREKQVAANAAMSAAAQEIQNRQQQQTQLQATPGYGRAMQGGAAMGKGGGGGGGLLGAISGKGGGTAQPAPSMGAPAQQGQPAASPGPGGVPTVGQAALPILGKIAQMPVPQAAKLVQAAFGGRGQGAPSQAGGGPSSQSVIRGQPDPHKPGFDPSAVPFHRTPEMGRQASGPPLPPFRPQFGAPPRFSPPERASRLPVPSAELVGKGGPPAVEQFAKGIAPDMAPYRESIAAIESRGSGDYGAVNPKTGATGRYQVMPANIPAWTREALGAPMSQQEFLKNPQAQDKVFDTVFGGYLKKMSPSDAASTWFTGKPLAQGAGRHDYSGTTGSRYVSAFNKNLGQDRIGEPAASSAKVTPASFKTPVPSASPSPQPQEKQGKASAAPQSSAPPPPDVYHPSTPDFAIQQPQQPPPQPSGPYPTTDPATGKQGYAQAPQVGPPKITSPDQLKGMKPGSLWISPDGKLRIVPMEGQ